MIRVFVVDDSVVVRQVVTDALRSDPTLEVCGIAQNGKVALEKIPAAKPDVVTLDIEMPEMDGLTTLSELRKTHPKLPVIMFSTLTERGASAIPPLRMPPAAAPAPGPAHAPLPPPIGLVMIAVSTGGPAALAEVVPHLPPGLRQPVLIVQHMPPVFTKVLAQRLASSSALDVREATHGERLAKGKVLLAPGDYHMRIAGSTREAWVTLDQKDAENGCRPAADPLFMSAAQIFGAHVLAVVMTGLGKDGTKGCAAVRKASGQVWAQDAATSTVWSMPGSVVEAGLAQRVLPLQQIARSIAQACEFHGPDGGDPRASNKKAF
jgi:two-component system chemotaxis response regulator CheB